MPLFGAVLSLFMLSGAAAEAGEVGSVGLPAAGGVAPVESLDVGGIGEVAGVSVGGTGAVEVPVAGAEDVPGAVAGAVDVPVCGVEEAEGEVEVPEEGWVDEGGVCWAVAALTSIAEKNRDASLIT